MTDSAYDLCPREQRLRVAAHILVEREQEIADACESLLLALDDPQDLPDIFPAPHVCFYPFTKNRAHAEDLAKRAARAAMAVLLADRYMNLPEHIGVAFNLPKLAEAIAPRNAPASPAR